MGVLERKQFFGGLTVVKLFSESETFKAFLDKFEFFCLFTKAFLKIYNIISTFLTVCLQLYHKMSKIKGTLSPKLGSIGSAT